MNMQKEELIIYDDKYDIWYKPWWHNPWIQKIVFLIILLGIVLVVWRLFKKYRAKKRTMTSWEAALYKLHAIKLDDYDNGKSFYFELTYILKMYLQARYGFDLEAKTDQEVIAFIQKTEFPRDLLDRLEKILHDAFTIKFAQKDVVIITMEQDLKRSIDIVRNTIPKNT